MASVRQNGAMADDPNELQRDEWRVEVNLDDEEHGYGLSERLRALRLDDEAREKLGGRIVVTRDGPRMFLYSDSEAGAAEAERVVRELVEQDRLSADIRRTRWHPDEEAWKDASLPLPSSEEERDAERARAKDAPWEVRVELHRLRAAVALERDLEAEGLPVERRFTYLLVGAPSEERANEIAERLRSQLGEKADVSVEPNVSDVPDPRFVVLEARKPGIARDLGL
jgi:hypothetical protein